MALVPPRSKLPNHDDAAGRIGAARHQRRIEVPDFNSAAASSSSSSACCPFGNKPIAPLFPRRGKHCESNDLSGATARAVTTSAGPAKRATKSSMRVACTTAGAPVTRCASRRKAAFLLLLSTRWTAGPGLAGERAGDHQARESTARAEIDPDARVRGKIEQLQRIGDMPRPEMRDRGRRDEIGRALPCQQEFDKPVEPFRRFT